MRHDAVVEIVRLEEDHLQGTFGAMRVNKQWLYSTLEQDDELNRPNVSSIPAQQYTCSRIISPHFGETFTVDNVPGRSVIRFHPGNEIGDTEGCIMLGLYIDPRTRTLVHSRRAFAEFMTLMEGIDRFHLTIREVY